MVNSTLKNGEVVNILLCIFTTLRNFIIYHRKGQSEVDRCILKQLLSKKSTEI